MSQSAKGASPRERWIALRAQFLAEIDAIDKATPWSEVEPDWWLEMANARRSVDPLPLREVRS